MRIEVPTACRSGWLAPTMLGCGDARCRDAGVASILADAHESNADHGRVGQRRSGTKTAAPQFLATWLAAHPPMSKLGFPASTCSCSPTIPRVEMSTGEVSRGTAQEGISRRP